MPSERERERDSALHKFTCTLIKSHANQEKHRYKRLLQLMQLSGKFDERTAKDGLNKEEDQSVWRFLFQQGFLSKQLIAAAAEQMRVPLLTSERTGYLCYLSVCLSVCSSARLLTSLTRAPTNNDTGNHQARSVAR